MRIKRLTWGWVMCERKDCGKPATLVLYDPEPEHEGSTRWMAAYCDEHARGAGYEAMQPPRAEERRGPGHKGARAAIAS